MKVLVTTAWTVTLVFLHACSADTARPGEATRPVEADTVLLGGKIYTVDAERSWAEAIAIMDGRILEVGSNERISQLAGDATEIVDLNGAMVLPGLHDTHIHVTYGETIFADGYCRLPDSNSNVSADELYGLIKECRDSNPDADGWFIGGGWPGGAFPPDGAPDKAPLDLLFPDRPVYLTADSQHLAWVNSRALEIAGIDGSTPNPENGEIKRDPQTGEATGTLFESAMGLVRAKIPPASQSQKDAALLRTMQYANSLGITSIFDAAVREENLASFARLHDEKSLPVHVRTAIWGGTESGTIVATEKLKELADKYERAGVKTHAVKLMLDGVMEGGTAAQLEPYIGIGHGGALFVSPEQLRESLVELDSAGMQVKMHGYGRLAVREGLNAIETAATENGFMGRRHHIDHLAQVHPDDYPRFVATKTVAGFSPYWAMPNSYEVELALPMLGNERWQQSYPIKSIEETGATIISGSDWPVSNMNPFLAIATGISRVDPVNPERGALNKAEIVTVESMIASFTINAAFVMHQEDITGSLEAGKSADLIIVDRNLIEASAEEIRETKVLRTIFKGKTVYSGGQ
jgi:predicted amidohydrolase YtcJ